MLGCESVWVEGRYDLAGYVVYHTLVQVDSVSALLKIITLIDSDMR